MEPNGKVPCGEGQLIATSHRLASGTSRKGCDCDCSRGVERIRREAERGTYGGPGVMDAGLGDRRTLLFGELEAFLAGLTNERPVYVPNPGNAGDALIAHGTYQLFERVLPAFDVGSWNQTYPGRTLIYGGGGNLVARYRNASDFIAANHQHCKMLVILPHTIGAHGDLIARLGTNCHIFCRDTTSYASVLSHAVKASVYLSHDLALGVDLVQTRTKARRSQWSGDFLRSHLRRRTGLWLAVAGHYWRTQGSGVLNAFRTDRESTERHTPSNNFDVSDIFATRDLSPAGCLHTVDMMMHMIAPYRSVRTDRLHICILSAMMGKHVDFFPNSYWKNQAVYEHSLSGTFPNVRWCAKRADHDADATLVA